MYNKLVRLWKVARYKLRTRLLKGGKKCDVARQTI
jgi:hypothetical protein